eukprot:4507719-Prymnesium_polylepis.2
MWAAVSEPVPLAVVASREAPVRLEVRWEAEETEARVAKMEARKVVWSATAAAANPTAAGWEADEAVAEGTSRSTATCR